MSEPEQAAALAEVDGLIQASQAALRQAGAGHPDRGRQLNHLGTAYMARFMLAGAQADLDDAIQSFEAAAAGISPAGPDRTVVLANLANALTERFERTGVAADCDAAISVAQAAVEATPAGHPALAGNRFTLGVALAARHQHTGALNDLNAAIGHFQGAADATDEPGPERAAMLANLGLMLRIRFERTADLADLDAGIRAGQAAVEATPAGDLDRVGFLSNLGLAFLRRFQRAGALTDADDAVKALRAAVTAAPAAYPHRAGLLSNLGVALQVRFARTAAPADLDAAISACQAAADTVEYADPRRAGMLNNIALALLSRFQRTGERADLDAAVHSAQESVAATPPGHPDRATHLTGLGRVLRIRFERTGDSADLDGAIRAAYDAVAATPPGHFERADALSNVGLTLRTRFRLTGLPSDRDAALAALSQAADLASAPPSARVRAAVSAGLLASHDPAWAARQLEAAVRLLTEVAPRELARADQQHAMGELAGLAGAAAAAALADPAYPEAERPARALALLEASRAVLLSQALDTRDDLTDLRREHRLLADRFTSLRGQLDQPVPAVAVPDDPLASLGRDAEQRERLARQLTRTLTEIRSLDGFATFGLPPAVGDLLTQASEGPVVTVTVSIRGGAAILLTASSITHIDLPGLTSDAVTGQVNAFHSALRAADSENQAARQDAQRILATILEWLWDNATGPVLHALGYRDQPPPGAPWPRVWWAPGGLLGLLPVHAAGYHTVADDGPAVLDRVVSSYTPTVRALSYARQQARHHDGPGRALIIAMPATPGGQQPLPAARKEADVVGAVLPDPVVLCEPEGDQEAGHIELPTRANVFRYLPGCTIAHFACHAYSDPGDPSRSLLLLHDYETAPLTVAGLATVDHERLELTYLSACGTAFTADTSLAEEAIHLTSAFQLAGSRHVIGTLWPANDLIATRIATAFYAGLRASDGAIDTGRSPVALHQAVRAMRDRWRHAPSLWAPYLHAGA